MQAVDRAGRSRASIPNRQWAPSRWRPRDIHPETLHQVLCSYTSDNQYRDTDRPRFVQTADDLHLAPKTCTPQWGSIRCKPVSRHNQCSSLWLSRECVVASFAPLYRRLQTSANVFLRCRTFVFLSSDAHLGDRFDSNIALRISSTICVSKVYGSTVDTDLV